MRNTWLAGGLLALMLTTMSGIASAADYAIDTAHSNIAFKIKHMGVSWVKGGFTEFEGTIAFDPANVDATAIEVTIQTASVDTRNEARDNHLRTPDFFDAEKYPTITFKSTGVKAFNGDSMILIGDLTMHGVTKEVELEVTELGPDLTIEEFKTTKRAASAKTMLHRSDFNISTKQMLGIGELALGDEVYIEIELELNKE